MKSKALVRHHIQSVLDEGSSQKEFARKVGFNNPNFVSMLLGSTSQVLLSPNRLEQFAKVCGLSDKEVIGLALARIDDAGDRPVEINKETLKYLFKTFVRVADTHRGYSRVGSPA